MYKCPFCGAEFLYERDYNEHVVKCPYQYGKPEVEEKEEVKVEDKPKKHKEK